MENFSFLYRLRAKILTLSVYEQVSGKKILPSGIDQELTQITNWIAENHPNEVGKMNKSDIIRQKSVTGQIKSFGFTPSQIKNLGLHIARMQKILSLEN